MTDGFDTITFLSDLGTRDELVGVVKAVIRDLAPQVTVLDLTHEITPFDVRAGSLALARSVAYLPGGVVLATVDPGVGTSRKAIAVEVANGAGVFVGPDNGLIAPAVAMAGGAGRCVVLDKVEYHLAGPGSTFAGRDVFAPVAAHLCNGVDLFELGTPIEADLLLPGVIPLPRDEAGVLIGEVLWVDRFGNCQLNVGPEEVEGWGDRIRVLAGDPLDGMTRVAMRAETFAGVMTGAVGLVVDSYGMLALVLDGRSAAEELRIGAGSMITLSPLGDEQESAPVAITTPVSFRSTN